jgi:hypothetical protein
VFIVAKIPFKFEVDKQKNASSNQQHDECGREHETQKRYANDAYQPCGTENQAKQTYHQQGKKDHQKLHLFWI